MATTDSELSNSVDRMMGIDDIDSNNSSGCNATTFVSIPSDSYTASRLQNCTVYELNKSSTVIFLGKIPEIWLLEKKVALFIQILGSEKQCRNKMEDKVIKDGNESCFVKADGLFGSKGTRNSSLGKINVELQQLSFKSPRIYQHAVIRNFIDIVPNHIKIMAKQQLKSHHPLKAVSGSSESINPSLYHIFCLGSNDYEKPDGSRLKKLVETLKYNYGSITKYKRIGTKNYSTRHAKIKFLQKAEAERKKIVFRNVQLLILLQQIKHLKKNHYSAENFEDLLKKPFFLSSKQLLKTNMLENTNLISHDRGKMTILSSELSLNKPECYNVNDIQMQEMLAEQRKKAVKLQIPSKCRHTIKSANDDETKDDNLKISTTLLQSYKPGQILESEKMLVQIIDFDGAKVVSGVYRETKKIQKWKEYTVLLRVGIDLNFPKVTQLEIKHKKLERRRLGLTCGDNSDETKNNLFPRTRKGIRKLHYDYSEMMAHCSKSFSHNQVIKEDKIFEQKNVPEYDSEIKKHFVTRKIQEKLYYCITISKDNMSLLKFNFASRSLSFIYEQKGKKRLFTLLFTSTSTAIIWHSLIKKLLSVDQAIEKDGFVNITIPLLDISFSINKSVIIELIKENSNNSKMLQFELTKTGYKCLKNDALEKLINLVEKAFAKHFVANRSEKYEKTRNYFRQLMLERSSLKLTYGGINLMEWSQQNLKYMLLDLTLLKNGNLNIEMENSQPLQTYNSLLEPTPVEGFLIKLSNQKGKKRNFLGKHYFKLLYAFTIKNMLFFQSFNTAVPIFPNLTNSVSSFITPEGHIVNLDALEEACMFEPQVFKYSPYPVTQDYIEWVKPGIDQQTFKIHDSAALFEAKRRAFMISKGHTSIDLLNVVEINSISCDKQNNEVKKACNSIWGQSVNDMNGRKEAHYISLASNKRTKDTTSFLEEERYTTAYFDLKMSDGSSISFNASNILIKNEWVKRLNEIRHFWGDKKAKMTFSTQCLSSPGTNHSMRYSLIQKAEKSAFSNSESLELVNSTLSNDYILARLTNTKQFHQCFAVINLNSFTLYKVFNRSKTKGKVKTPSYFKKYVQISLKGCYVFPNTGVSCYEKTDLDFLSKEKGLSRVYGDGFISSDPLYDCLLTLWYGTKNKLHKNKRRVKNYHLDKLHDPTADNRNINCSVPLEEVKHNIRELNFSGSSSELTDSEDDINILSEESDAMIEFESETNKCDYYETIPLKHANKFQSTKLSHSFGTRERSLKLLARSKAERDLWIAKLNSEIDNLSTVSSINSWRI